jgi:protein gp37
MSDVFHADIPEAYTREMFEVMLEASQHTYQILTKRPSRARRFWLRNRDLFDGKEIPPHIWIGSSVEDQDVLYRVDHLREVAAEVRFLSCEPLLGPLDLDLEGIHWVIVGGESGLQRRPMKTEWVVSTEISAPRPACPSFSNSGEDALRRQGGGISRGWSGMRCHG